MIKYPHKGNPIVLRVLMSVRYALTLDSASLGLISQESFRVKHRQQEHTSAGLLCLLAAHHPPMTSATAKVTFHLRATKVFKVFIEMNHNRFRLMSILLKVHGLLF